MRFMAWLFLLLVSHAASAGMWHPEPPPGLATAAAKQPPTNPLAMLADEGRLATAAQVTPPTALATTRLQLVAEARRHELQVRRAAAHHRGRDESFAFALISPIEPESWSDIYESRSTTEHLRELDRERFPRRDHTRFVIDDVRVAVPEPGSALGLLVVAALAGRWRRN